MKAHFWYLNFKYVKWYLKNTIWTRFDIYTFVQKIWNIPKFQLSKWFPFQRV